MHARSQPEREAGVCGAGRHSRGDLNAKRHRVAQARHRRRLDGFIAAAPATPPPVRIRASDAFSIVYSSGATGLPKGIVQTQRARTHWAFSNAIELGMGEASRALTTTALYANGSWLMMLPVQPVTRPAAAAKVRWPRFTRWSSGPASVSVAAMPACIAPQPRNPAPCLVP